MKDLESDNSFFKLIFAEIIFIRFLHQACGVFLQSMYFFAKDMFVLSSQHSVCAVKFCLICR